MRKTRIIFLYFKEVCEIEKLIPLMCLGELSLINNPVKIIKF